MATITEGQEYRIFITQGFDGGKYTKQIFHGIAESDTEASERIEGLELYYSAFNKTPYPVRITIEAL